MACCWGEFFVHIHINQAGDVLGEEGLVPARPPCTPPQHDVNFLCQKKERKCDGMLSPELPPNLGEFLSSAAASFPISKPGVLGWG